MCALIKNSVYAIVFIMDCVLLIVDDVWLLHLFGCLFIYLHISTITTSASCSFNTLSIYYMLKVSEVILIEFIYFSKIYRQRLENACVIDIIRGQYY